VSEFFSRAAQWTSRQCGRAHTFGLAILIIIVWAAFGPALGYSDTWQLIINTGTTIVTFLMVFLIQNTQNRDTAAIQLKLDELIRANQDARNRLLNLEDLSEKEMDQLKASFVRLGRNEALGVLREAKEELRSAEEDIEDAQTRIRHADAALPDLN